MTKITDLKEIDAIIRTMLVTQSQLNSSFVRTNHSLYGTSLDKNTTANIFESITATDTLILFEVYARDSEYDVSMTEENGHITYDKAFQVHITMYGDNSLNLAQKLVGRIRTLKVRDDLYAQGVYVEDVSEVTKLEEFKNEVIWMRNDFDINIACELDITQVNDYVDIEAYSGLNIYNT